MIPAHFKGSCAKCSLYGIFVMTMYKEVLGPKNYDEPF